MSWAQAIQTLKIIIAEMSIPSNGMEWLNRLEKQECKDAYRLGFCIAIDFASGALSAGDFAEVLNQIDNSENCPRKAFADAFARNARRDDLICRSRLDVPSVKSETYIRVLSLQDFITYYKKNRTLSPDDVAAVRTEYFSAYAATDLSDIREWWSGANGVVWVMSREEFDALSTTAFEDALATLLNDALGLGKKPTASENDGRELVGVVYPRDFNMAKQPTTLDADWAEFGWYYVSFGKENGWGQTVSCSGSQTPLGERVHKSFDRLSSEFVGFPIGKILGRTINREALLGSADRRLESILELSS